VEFNGQRKHVMSYLTDFLFSPERANSPVRTLSGGERNRLLLARLFALPANVLVLDEPTNDLDIDTLELLEELLQGYSGTVFLVSHDRRFLDNVVTSLVCWEGDLEPGKWREYEGNVGDWQAQRARMLAAKAASAPVARPAAAAPAAAPASAAAPAAAKRKLSYKEQRERDELPARIAALEAEQAAISAKLADGSLYASAPQEAASLSQRHADIDDELLAALERQEELGAA
jgi:ATP-binding cassette subfamily F protein uup